MRQLASIAWVRMSMTPAALVLGLLIGWLIEWVIDCFIGVAAPAAGRRRISHTVKRYNKPPAHPDDLTSIKA
jgi:hypothetical protein